MNFVSAICNYRVCLFVLEFGKRWISFFFLQFHSFSLELLFIFRNKIFGVALLMCWLIDHPTMSCTKLRSWCYFFSTSATATKVSYWMHFPKEPLNTAFFFKMPPANFLNFVTNYYLYWYALPFFLFLMKHFARKIQLLGELRKVKSWSFPLLKIFIWG